MSSPAKLRKANRLIGRALVFRNAQPEDAELIVALRTDTRIAKYLSVTSAEIAKQIDWLKQYAGGEDQAYFIIEANDGEKLGTVRLYDPQGDSFCWGSWILKEGAPQSAAIESALMVYSYAIDCLGFKNAHFDVRKENEHVWRFHERLGAVRVAEKEHDFIYKISGESIAASRQRYKKYLSDAVKVEM
ncbi:MAG: GNAT family N-acetyltransferase [Sideroxyarcus sp.]|nr:GNAT family N-acetyltransferase [Sideroxyarcus sp.]